jgi:SNARE protein 1
VQPENEKSIIESIDEISYEEANAESPISLSSGVRRRST